MKKIIKTLAWEKDKLVIIDQSKLPAKEQYLILKNIKNVHYAIRHMQVRGAPAIGLVAVFGLILGFKKSDLRNLAVFNRTLKKNIAYLKSTRPTAYNLFWALNRLEAKAKESYEKSPRRLREILLTEAIRMVSEDEKMSLRIGEHGAGLIKNGMNVLTHCNAGGLATSGFGTALAVLFSAREKGRKFSVFVDETRPRLQGARLTAWELKKAGIDFTLICDNMAGWLMGQRKVDLVVVGADRIARNGDTANKIGTYSLAVLAHHHKIPFYVAAPISTFDPGISSGSEIVIEERPGEEILNIGKKIIAPARARVCNPAFDVTPARFITGFLTERGILKPPFE